MKALHFCGLLNYKLFCIVLLYCSINLPEKVFSQICTGSFGDPVVNIDFGRGTGNFGPSLGSNTNYQYVASLNPGGDGNDLALDDITFRACGSKITPLTDNTSQAEKAICEGNGVVLSAIIDWLSTLQYQ